MLSRYWFSLSSWVDGAAFRMRAVCVLAHYCSNGRLKKIVHKTFIKSMTANARAVLLTTALGSKFTSAGRHF